MNTRQGQDPSPARSNTRVRVLAPLLVVLVVAAAVVVPLVTSSSSPGGSAAVGGGWVYLDQPLSQADLTVATSAGSRIGDSVTTSANGTFRLPGKVPDAFRITATGGEVGSQVFTGDLVADVHGYHASRAPLEVNPVTTLAAAYRDAHPGLSVDDATARVQRFLALPSAITLDTDLRGATQWFSSQAFLSQATPAGGVQPFVRQLVSEMDRDPSATHPFVGTAHNDVVTMNIVGGVVSKLASTAFGSVLQSVGIGDSVQADVLSSLSQIQAQLTQLQASVDQIAQALTQASYDKWASDVITIKNAVTDTFSKLKWTADSGDKSGLTQIQDTIKGLISTNALRNLNSDLTGEAATTGAYRAWSNLIKSKTTFWGATQSNQLLDYFDYYDTVQAELIYLIREYDLATGVSQDFFNANDLATYNSQRAAQLATRGTVKVPQNIEVDLRTNFVWPTQNPNARLVPYCAVTIATTKGPVQGKCTTGGTLPMTLPNVTTSLQSLNDQSFLGANNWRLPSVGDFRTLAPGQSNPRAYLVSQFGGTDTLFAICAPTCNNVPPVDL